MPIQYTAAIDELLGMIKTAWDAGALSIAGYEPEIRWPGNPIGTKPDMTKYWGRPSTQIVLDGQSSLANDQGLRRYQAQGLLYFQLFCPRNVADSLENGRLLAEVIRTAFREGSPSGDLWFRNQKIVELPETDESYPINVVVEFLYDTLQ